MTEPLLSIIFGTYNRLSRLKACVASVRGVMCHAGSFPGPELRYEIIVVDGGSTDGSRQWLAEQAGDDVVIVGRRELLGAVDAFNNGYMVARGQYIALLNDDVEVHSGCLVDAVRYLEDPNNGVAGQVAFTYQVRDKKTLNYLSPPDHYYANFGVVRRSIVDQVYAITGGMWSPVYHTYGGDCELSCWVYRLGYKVHVFEQPCVVDHEALDALRMRNSGERAAKDRRTFWKRWAKMPEMLSPKGPLPYLTEREKEALRRLESGEALPPLPPPPPQTPAAAQSMSGWTSTLDKFRPEDDHAPWRVKELPGDERVLHLHLSTPAEPQGSLAKAVDGLGVVRRVDWISLDEPTCRAAILRHAKELKPTLVFMQLQRPGAVSLTTLRQLRSLCAQNAVIVHWTGDITNQYPAAWYHSLGPGFDLMLFSCADHADAHRKDGLQQAAYLQIGYDEDRYFPGPDKGYGRKWDVAFLSRKYDEKDVPIGLGTHEGFLRRAVGNALLRRYRKRAAVFGGGWPGKPVQPSVSGDLYRASLLGVSISAASDLNRYSSDRLLRIMGSGLPAVIKRFKGMESWGLVEGENCLAFNDVKDMCELLDEWLGPNHVVSRRRVGKAGAQLVQEHHTWSVRMAELMAYVAAVRGDRVEVTRPW